MTPQTTPWEELVMLLPLPPIEAQRFAAARDAVTVRVDRAIFQRPDLGMILNDVPPSTVREMHRQHASFMAAVFNLGVPELLFEGLPALYRGYLGRGLPEEYLEVAPEVWAEAVASELGPSVPGIERLQRWLEQHPQVWAPGDQVAPRKPETGSPAERLCRSLLHSDPAGARGTIRNELRQGSDLITVFRDVISPALHEIGRRWETGTITVAQEHMASAMVARILSELGHDLPGAGRQVAVVSSAPNEPHEFAAWMVADVLRGGGWEVRFLGASRPMKEIATYVGACDPDLVAVSCTLPVHLPGLKRLVETLKDDASTDEIPILVGGQAFEPGEAVWRVTGADGYAKDAAGILDAAARLQALRTSRAAGGRAQPRS